MDLNDEGRNNMKTVLLLGKNDVIEEYAERVLKVDMKFDILRCPAITDHHTEYVEYVGVIRDETPPVITTQNLEMIDILLESDLDFKVITAKRIDDEIRTRILSKEDVVKNREAWNFDPRD